MTEKDDVQMFNPHAPLDLFVSFFPARRFSLRRLLSI